MAEYKEPKRFDIPSSSYGITAEEASETLVRAEEIKSNKPLMKEAARNKKALEGVVKSLRWCLGDKDVEHPLN